MKWLLALVALTAVGAVGGLVFAVRGTRDPVPARLQACIRDSDAEQVRSQIGLQIAAPDIDARAVRVVRRGTIGEDRVVLLEGARYRILVLAGRKSPSLAGDLPRRVYQRTGEYATVAIEIDPIRGQLDACARVAGRQ